MDLADLFTPHYSLELLHRALFYLSALVCSLRGFFANECSCIIDCPLEVPQKTRRGFGGAVDFLQSSEGLGGAAVFFKMEDPPFQNEKGIERCGLPRD